MMNLTPEYSVAKSKQLQFSVLQILNILKKSSVGFIIILVPTFALNIIKGLLLAIAAVT